MKKVVVVFGGVVLCGLAAVAQGPVVSNVQFTQPVPGLVAITYDLAQLEEKPCLVWVELSKDGGATYPFAVSMLSGDHGFDVVPGTGKRIEWRADREFPGEDIASAKLRVVADDDNLPFTGYVLRFADIAFVWMDAGTFEMGQAGTVEPVHQVTLTQGFWLSKYEVTQAQWEAVMGGNPSSFQSDPANDPQRPVDAVSWNDIQGFLTALNAGHPGETFRLPTEAEWEYACRAGTTAERHYWGGDELIANYAWYRDNSGGMTHPVGQKRANEWGLYDMYGNAWEWVQDWSGAYAADAQTDPTGPATGTSRVLRGGGWGLSDYNCSSANRLGGNPDSRFNLYGFRLLRIQD